MPVAKDNVVTNEGAQLGRFLFYDSILSRGKNMSCASCHRQEFAFSDAPKAFSSGNNGVKTNRNSQPLFNLAWYPSYFWDGRANSLEEQVFHPVRDQNEMNLDWKTAEKRIQQSSFYRQQFKAAFGHKKIDSVLIAKCIAQFMRTLISYQSKFDRVIDRTEYLSKEEFRGFRLMNDMTKGNCLHCHTTDQDILGTTGQFSNNGLDAIFDPELYADKGLGKTTHKASDNGKFKIPTLRNIALTAPYMHDGRFKTLEEVLDFYSEGVKPCVNIDSKMTFAHQGGSHLTTEEKKAIIAFLNTFTDSLFIANPEFSNPFR